MNNIQLVGFYVLGRQNACHAVCTLLECLIHTRIHFVLFKENIISNPSHALLVFELLSPLHERLQVLYIISWDVKQRTFFRTLIVSYRRNRGKWFVLGELVVYLMIHNLAQNGSVISLDSYPPSKSEKRRNKTYFLLRLMRISQQICIFILSFYVYSLHYNVFDCYLKMVSDKWSPFETKQWPSHFRPFPSHFAKLLSKFRRCSKWLHFRWF